MWAQYLNLFFFVAKEHLNARHATIQSYFVEPYFMILDSNSFLFESYAYKISFKFCALNVHCYEQNLPTSCLHFQIHSMLLRSRIYIADAMIAQFSTEKLSTSY